MVEFYIDPEEEILIVFQSISLLWYKLANIFTITYLIFLPHFMMNAESPLDYVYYFIFIPIIFFSYFIEFWDKKAIFYFTTNKIVIAYPRWLERHFKRYIQMEHQYNEICYFTIKKSKNIEFFVEIKEPVQKFEDSKKPLSKKYQIKSKSYLQYFRKKDYPQFEKIVNILEERVMLRKNANPRNSLIFE